MYIVCAIIRNAPSRLYGNQTAEIFQLDPPSLDDLELSITLTSILHCFRFNGSCMKVVFGTRQHHRISKLAMPWRLAQGWVTFRI